jgi:ParB-like chromosome segregation protein Spo0J
MDGLASELLDQTRAALREGHIELPGKAAMVRTDQLVPNTWNPNRQDPETFAKEKVSLQRFGFVVPIITRSATPGSKFEIVDGEHRWKAAIELGMEWVPIYDLGNISEHEAMQLTIVLNELRGKPEEKKLGDVLKRLLNTETIDTLTEVLPYSKEDVGRIAELPEFDWEGFKEKNRKADAERHVERIFRLKPDAAKVLDEALKKAKEDDDRVSDAEALEAIAADFLAGA